MTGLQEKRTTQASAIVGESSNGMKTVVKKKDVVIKVNGVKDKEKKVYSLPGQRHDPPEERDPLRVFYESLREQIPTSEMAETWMLEHGLLTMKEAEKALEKKHGRRLGTPVKASPASKISNGKAKVEGYDAEFKDRVAGNGSRGKSVPAAKRKLDNSDSDDEFISSRNRKVKAKSRDS